MPIRKWTATNSARTFSREVADRLSCQIADNRAPWQKQWDKPTGADLPPFNPATGKRYHGLNAIQLRSVAEEKGFNDPRWITYSGAKKMGAHVRAGEQGTKVEYLRYHPDRDSTHHTHTVFNAEQINGLPSLEQHLPKEPQQWEVCERAERMIRASGAVIEHETTDSAFYEANEDKIVLPDHDLFRSPEAYYATSLHELSHWTGHESRLDRETLQQGVKDGWASENYALEELRAEISCMNMSSLMRLPKESTYGYHDHHWIKTLKNNPDDLRSAVRDADRMAKYILQYDRPADRSLNVSQIPRAAHGVDDLPERKSTIQREPYQAQDHSDADALETLRNMPKPWASYPSGGSGAYAKPSRDRDNDTFSR